MTPDELAELRLTYAVSHGLAPTAAQREAVAAWDTMLADEYAPRPTLKVPAHSIERARYPVIDVHKHLGYVPDRGWPVEVDEFVDGMDRLNVRAFVNLDGLSGVHLRRVL
ncbi:MAG TPA: hypothetical protein VNM48_10665, partial [Chloroflexota bacterium]|nr:hypothetical protein [Chloroflexota bacterium]